MTAQRLLYKRILEHWKFQFASLRMAVDWTVALYIVAPGIFFAGYVYRTLWVEPPHWMTLIPPEVPFSVLFLFCFSRGIRVFLEMGDQLFLLQRREWAIRLISGGCVYTLLVQFASTTMVFGILAPLMMGVYGMSIGVFMAWGVFTFLFKANISFVFHLLTIRFAGWRRWLLAGLLFIIGSVSYIASGKACLLLPIGVVLWLLCFLLAGTLSFLIRRRIRVKGAFFGDIEREHKKKMKIAALLLSQVIEKRPSSPRSRPLLFRRSGRLFRRRTPGAGVAEAALKAFVRSVPRMKLYVQFVVVVTYAVAVVPSWMKWLLWIALAFMLASWLRRSGQELLDSRYLRLFRWEVADLSDGLSRAVFVLLLPATLMMSAALACSAWSERLWMAVPFMLAAGTGLAHAASQLVMLGARIGNGGPPEVPHDSVRDG